MPHPKPPITLIVASTPIRTRPSPSNNEPTTTKPKLGIGQNGTLPWPRIKADMSFFARVTSRPPHPDSTNAVIMGRKTYDSVPSHLRPLARRINVVVSRDREGTVKERVLREVMVRREKLASSSSSSSSSGSVSSGATVGNTVGNTGNGNGSVTDAIVSPSLQAALATLDGDSRLGKIFVIGGAEIYAAALRMTPSELQERPLRVVMTDVRRKEGEFECDTFFPVEEFTAHNGWREGTTEEVGEWVGETVEREWRDEGDVLLRMVGFERLAG